MFKQRKRVRQRKAVRRGDDDEAAPLDGDGAGAVGDAASTTTGAVAAAKAKAKARKAAPGLSVKPKNSALSFAEADDDGGAFRLDKTAVRHQAKRAKTEYDLGPSDEAKPAAAGRYDDESLRKLVASQRVRAAPPPAAPPPPPPLPQPAPAAAATATTVAPATKAVRFEGDADGYIPLTMDGEETGGRTYLGRGREAAGQRAPSRLEADLAAAADADVEGEAWEREQLQRSVYDGGSGGTASADTDAGPVAASAIRGAGRRDESAHALSLEDAAARVGVARGQAEDEDLAASALRTRARNEHEAAGEAAAALEREVALAEANAAALVLERRYWAALVGMARSKEAMVETAAGAAATLAAEAFAKRKARGKARAALEQRDVDAGAAGPGAGDEAERADNEERRLAAWARVGGMPDAPGDNGVPVDESRDRFEAELSGADDDEAEDGFEARRDALRQAAAVVFEDVADTYTLGAAAGRAVAWRERDPASFEKCYVELSLRRVAGPAARLETVFEWRHGAQPLEALAWHACASRVGGALLADLAQDVALPVLAAHLADGYDPASGAETAAAVARAKQVLACLGDGREAARAALAGHVAAAFSAAAAAFPVHAEPRGGRLQRVRLFAAAKLARNAAQWAAAGVGVHVNVDTVVADVEKALESRLRATDAYPVDEWPTETHWELLRVCEAVGADRAPIRRFLGRLALPKAVDGGDADVRSFRAAMEGLE